MGDNLIHGAIYLAYPNHGIGADFSDIFENTNKYTQAADLAYINAETMLAAKDTSELSHYPVFNGPVSYLNAIDHAGFDWISMASNHALDTGSEGIFYEISQLMKIIQILLIQAFIPVKNPAKPCCDRCKRH